MYHLGVTWQVDALETRARADQVRSIYADTGLCCMLSSAPCLALVEPPRQISVAIASQLRRKCAICDVFATDCDVNATSLRWTAT